MIIAAALFGLVVPAAQVAPAVAAAPASVPGDSRTTAIVVRAVSEEYSRLRAHQLKPEQQSLIVDGRRAFDVLKATDASGGMREIWFDISSFYGKEFGL